MRQRDEILNDAIEKTYEGKTIPEIADTLPLLRLEVLVDTRDILEERLFEIERVLGRFEERLIDYLKQPL